MNVDVHIGIVSANDTDPEKEFGIEVRIDSVSFDEKFPVLVYPFFAPNFFKVPDLGQTVLVVLPADLPLEGFEGEETALNEFADQAFYMLRGFDSASAIGKMHPDMTTNYPKRSGWWFQNGTIILVDETKGSEEIWIRLTDGNEGIKITNKGIAFLSSTKIRLGDSIASEAAHLGTTMNGNLNSFLLAWQSLLKTLGGASLDPATVVYANAMSATTVGPIDILINQLPSWLSQKTFLDV